MAHRGSSAWREKHFGTHCGNPKTLIRDWLPGVNIYVDARSYEAFVALADVMSQHFYEVRSRDTGSYNCRPIRGSNAWSAHAWGLAADVNWSTNPYRKTLVTDMPDAMVKAALAIRTERGEQRVFKWGGDWDNRPETDHSIYDAMHWEVIATPTELKSGIVVPRGHRKPASKVPAVTPHWTDRALGALPVLSQRTGSKSPFTRKVQLLVNSFLTPRFNVKVDGAYGPNTAKAVARVQGALGLTKDGICGRNTWGALTGLGDGHMPTLRAGMKGRDVTTLQAVLSATYRTLAVDGDFGPKTEAAVRRFQRSRDLAVDGLVGPNTWTVVLVR